MADRQRIPVEVLLAPPERSGVALSPDGTRISFSSPVDGTPTVWVQTVGDAASARPVVERAGVSARTAFWAYDGRYLCYLRDDSGSENTHLHAVDLQSGEDRDLTPFDGVRVEFVDRRPAFASELVIAVNLNDPAMLDAYRLNVVTGELALLARNPGSVAAPAPHLPGAGWVAGPDFMIRAATIARDGGRIDVVVADPAADLAPDKWSTVRSWGLEDTRGSRVVGFSADGRRLHLIDCVDSNTARVVTIDPATGTAEVLFQDPSFDVTLVATSPQREPVAVMVDADRARWHATDARVDRIVDDANNRSDAHMVALSCDVSAERWLVTWTSPQRGVWWDVVDVGTHGTGQASVRVADMQPALAAYDLPARLPVSYAARDGLTIHGYLTTPVGYEPPGPMVLFPHGGPWSRDYWDFDPMAVWLADRGYLVLQPNFRGSTGYGKTFLNAGNREWGAKMHDDLVDGVDWTVAQGLADPARVAIFGGSYGGYAALIGATFTPTMFACIVDLFGWGDLVVALKNLPAYWGPRLAQWYERVGNPHTEPEFLWSRSPLSRIDDLCRPLLIAQGGNDVRVPQEASEQIVAELNKRNLDHVYLVFPDEGHEFVHLHNVVAFYSEAEQFLARHLGTTPNSGHSRPATPS